MVAEISESLFEKRKSSFDMLNRNWVFIVLFSNIIIIIYLFVYLFILSKNAFAMLKYNQYNNSKN